MNSACTDREDGLIALLYEDGEEAVLAEMRAHLATCGGCRAEFERLCGTRELLGAWPDVVNAPRMVYVHEPSGVAARVRQWMDEVGWLGLRAFLRPLAAAAAVVLVFVASVSLLDLRVDPDGSVSLGFGHARTEATQMSDTAGGGLSEPAPGITREEFETGLARMVAYIDDLVNTTREQDRRTFFAALQQRFDEQGLTMSQQFNTAINAALDQIGQQRQADFQVMAASLEDLRVITATELQQMNTILASLVQTGTGLEKE